MEQSPPPFAFLWRSFIIVFVLVFPDNMDMKNEPNQFDINKICRTCLTEKEEMRSVFLADESIGQAMRLVEMIMDFSSVQVRLFVYFEQLRAAVNNLTVKV